MAKENHTVTQFQLTNIVDKMYLSAN